MKLITFCYNLNLYIFLIKLRAILVYFDKKAHLLTQHPCVTKIRYVFTLLQMEYSSTAIGGTMTREMQRKNLTYLKKVYTCMLPTNPFLANQYQVTTRVPPNTSVG